MKRTPFFVNVPFVTIISFWMIFPTRHCAIAASPAVKTPQITKLLFLSKDNALLLTRGKLLCLNLSTTVATMVGDAYDATVDEGNNRILAASQYGEDVKFSLYDIVEGKGKLIAELVCKNLRVTQIVPTHDLQNPYCVVGLAKDHNCRAFLLGLDGEKTNLREGQTDLNISHIPILDQNVQFIDRICFSRDPGGAFAIRAIISPEGASLHPELLGTSQPDKKDRGVFAVFRNGKLLRSWAQRISYPRHDNFQEFGPPLAFSRGQIFINIVVGSHDAAYYAIDPQSGSMKAQNLITSTEFLHVVALSNDWSSAISFNDVSFMDNQNFVKRFIAEMDLPNSKHLQIASFDQDIDPAGLFWGDKGVICDGMRLWICDPKDGAVTSHIVSCN